MIRVAILSVCDKASLGEQNDVCAQVIEELISELPGKKVYFKIIPDQFNRIQEELFNITERGIAEVILTTGGTGFARRDITPEATLAVIEKEVPGLPEMMRCKAGQINPEIFLSRARAGIRKNTLIVNLPGKQQVVRECLTSILPVLQQGVDILNGEMH